MGVDEINVELHLTPRWHFKERRGARLRHEWGYDKMSKGREVGERLLVTLQFISSLITDMIHFCVVRLCVCQPSIESFV